jgi:hypothetical protein
MFLTEQTMPTYSGYWYSEYDSNPRKWERSCLVAKQQMISEGWNPLARKFMEVLRRRARKIYYGKQVH